MSLFERGEDAIYRCSAFREFTWLKHGFGTRTASPKTDVTLRQIHSNIVVDARGLEDRGCEGDGLITNDSGRAVGVRTADCVPILLFDSKRRLVSAVHAGWRGTAAEILPVTIQTLKTEFGTQPSDLFAAVGPCIRQCCYEVSRDVADQFPSIHAVKSGDFDEWHLDLAGINRTQMLNYGLSADHVFDIARCTSCESNDFFSYRREPANPGRMISSIERTA